jgi:hypothetical protein
MTAASPEARWRKAYESASNHRLQVEASKRCGCFNCKTTFPAAEVVAWDDTTQTALCPRCGVDAVIGDASGEPVNDLTFLRKMHTYWL